MSGPGECLERDDSGRRDAFARLQETYGEAQKHVPAEGTYEELQWILGARRNGTQDPLSLGTKTIELIALWLQDLVREMEQRSPARTEAALNLRDATVGFLQAFRRDPANSLELDETAPALSR